MNILYFPLVVVQCVEKTENVTSGQLSLPGVSVHNVPARREQQLQNTFKNNTSVLPFEQC